MAKEYLFTSESVSEGHPDKVADQISDGVLDVILGEDPHGRVACETLVSTGLVVISGEITTKAHPNYREIAQDVIRRIGYDDSDIGFVYKSCAILTAINRQSPDIAQGVGKAFDDPLDQGAGDQGLMFGFACDETPALMPLPIDLAHRLAERLTEVRKSGLLEYLRPDGKTQVTIGYDGERAVSLDAVVVSTQHEPDLTQDDLTAAIREHVIAPVLAEHAPELGGLDGGAKVYVNPTGTFVVGGPMGDAGLTGRKIIVDTYGGMARHGGGAFSGKDPSKVDRSAAYAMRWVAKNVVAAGLARRCEVQVAYAIGRAHPMGLYVETFGTETVDPARIGAAIRDVFDLRPAAIVRDLDLLRPIYRATSAYGHFGRELPDFTWERTDRVDALRSAAGL